MRSKITIIGTGSVGATIAYTIAVKSIASAQAPLEWPPGSDLWGWSLGLCILTPPLVTLIHSRATEAFVMGRRVVWRGAARRGRKHQEEEREVPGQRKVLTMSSLPSCFSPNSPHNLA